MIQYMIPLVSQFFSSGFVSFFFIPLFCLAGLATIPCLIRHFLRWR